MKYVLIPMILLLCLLPLHAANTEAEDQVLSALNTSDAKNYIAVLKWSKSLFKMQTKVWDESKLITNKSDREIFYILKGNIKLSTCKGDRLVHLLFLYAHMETANDKGTLEIAYIKLMDRYISELQNQIDQIKFSRRGMETTYRIALMDEWIKIHESFIQSTKPFMDECRIMLDRKK